MTIPSHRLKINNEQTLEDNVLSRVFKPVNKLVLEALDTSECTPLDSNHVINFRLREVKRGSELQ